MRKKRYLEIILALILAFSLLISSAGPALAKQDKAPSMDPDFLKLVQEYPDEVFKVIVQRDAKNKDLKDMELEDEVIKGGGKVLKELGLIVSFSAELTGKEVEKLAKNPKVRWISPDAPVTSTSSAGLNNVLDNFSRLIYVGNDGTESWARGWTEGTIQNGDVEDSTPTTGVFLVANSYHCANQVGNCLRMDPYYINSYVYREVNLGDAASATLSFFRNNRLFQDTGAVVLEISSDGGTTWTQLQSYSANSLIGSGTDIFDITAFVSSNTQVRFRVTNSQFSYNYIFFDDIQIEYAYPSPYREIVGADLLSHNGQGVTVAVVDSGISNHIDLSESDLNVNQALSSNSRILQNVVFGEYTSPIDEYAHGTHVAGVIGGNGVASGGKYVGIAPGVNLLNIRVSNEQGLTYISDVVEGLEWVYENKDIYNIRVLNLSINSTMPESYHTSALDAAVEILWFNGITVVVAAGNNGTADGPSTLYPPANDPFVITVGAIEDNGTVALDDDFVGEFSAYGITQDGFSKPDLVAPGRNLISLLAGTDATAYVDHPKHHVDNFYFRMSGTSMSAPVVSGVIALVLQENPNLNPDQIKYRLMQTANQQWVGYSSDRAGAGTVNAYFAVYNETTGSANQGIMPSYMLLTGDDAIAYDSVGWNSVGWNSVGWNSVGWNSVGWNSVGWNSVGWNSVGWNTSLWSE